MRAQLRKLRKHLPDSESVRNNRWLAPFATTLLHPRLWHLNRHSAAGAVAAGLFCGLIPGPLQMLGGALCAVAFRLNLPLTLLVTLYSNPLTIVPLYLVAFGLGEATLGLAGLHDGDGFVAPPDYSGDPVAWIGVFLSWMAKMGRPLALGLLLLASLLAFTGYLIVRTAWRIHLVRAWRQRARTRAMKKSEPTE
jgi:uncharacterized protein